MINDISQKLEQVREKMIQSGMTHGFLHDQTIRLSEQVDMLMNLYYAQTSPLRNSVTPKN